MIKNTKFDINIYPNPVKSSLFIALKNSNPKNYQVEISNMVGQKIMSKIYNNVQNLIIEYPRSAATAAGIYTLIITDLQNKEVQTYKVIFR